MPWQAHRHRLADLGLTVADAQKQVWLVHQDGRLSGGAAAVNGVLRFIWWARPLAWLSRFPEVLAWEENLYRWVAGNRHRLPGGSDTCALPAYPAPPKVEEPANRTRESECSFSL